MHRRPFVRYLSRHKVGVCVLVALLALVAVRDPLLTWGINHQLAKVPDVKISFASLNLHLVPGSLALHDVRVERRQDPEAIGKGSAPLPLAQVSELTVSWRYGALLQGTLAASADVTGVKAEIWRVEARRAKDPKARQASKPVPPSERETSREVVPEPPPPETIQAIWPEIARFLLPVSLDSAEVRDAEVIWHDLTTKPPVHFSIGGIAASATNLTNRAKLSGGNYGHVSVKAAPAGGLLGLEVELDPLAKRPTFSLLGSLDHLQVPKTNDVLQAYAKLDTLAGEVNARFAFRCEQGRYAGTVEPRVVGLEIRPEAKEEASNTWVNRLYRKAVGAVTSVLEDNKSETVATRVPIAGEFADPEIGVGSAVLSLLGNAFIKALTPGAGDAAQGHLTRKKSPGSPVVPELPARSVKGPADKAGAAPVAKDGAPLRATSNGQPAGVGRKPAPAAGGPAPASNKAVNAGKVRPTKGADATGRSANQK